MAFTRVVGAGIHTAANINSHNIKSTGIITATKFDGPFDTLNVTGDVDFLGNVSIGGTLTYEDVTNIDSVGLVTAREGIFLPDNKKIELGNVAGSGDLQLYHDGGHSRIVDNGTGNLVVQTDGFRLRSTDQSEVLMMASKNNSVDLYYDNDKKFETSAKGIQVGTGVTIETNGQTYSTGISTTTENFYIKPDTQQNRGIYIGSNGQLRLQYTGGANQSYLRSSAAFLSIASNNFFIQRYDTNYTMASFRAGQQCKLTYNYVDRIATSGVGATVYGQFDTTNLTIAGVSTFTGNIDANGDLDVDGHTNLDNVSIVGVTTVTGEIKIPDLSGSSNKISVGTNQNLQIYYDSSSYITNNTAGHLFIKTINGGSDINLESADDFFVRTNGQNSIIARDAGQVELYHNNTKRLETFDNNPFVGVSVTNDVVLNGAGDTAYRWAVGGNASSNFKWSMYYANADGALRLFDNVNSRTVSVWKNNGTIELNYQAGKRFETTAGGAAISNIQNNDGLVLNGVSNNTCIKFLSTGSSPAHGYRIAYHSTTNYAFNSPSITFDKIATNGNFSNHVAAISDTGFHLPDNMKLHVGGTTGASGATGDLQLYHNGNNSYIKSSTGNLWLGVNNYLNIAGGDDFGTYTARFLDGGPVELYHSGNKKFETTNTGAVVTGEVAASQDYPNIRPTLDFNFAAVKKLDSRITYDRSGPASFVNEFGKVVIVGDNVPRFDHDQDTGECKGLLIEESRTNISPYSNDLSGFSSVNMTKTANDAVAPDGTTTATKLERAGSGNNWYLDYVNNGINAQNAGTYTYSVWVKAPDDQPDDYYGCRIALLYSTGGNVEVNFGLSRNWRRISVTKTYGASDSGKLRVHPIIFRASPGGNLGGGYIVPSYVWVWGAQLEQGAFATSYIPIAGATRGADFALIDGEEFTEFFNQVEGTIITSTNSLNTSATQYSMVIEGDNTNNERHMFVESNNYQYQIRDGGATQAQIDAGSISTKNIIAAAYKLNDTAVSINGSDAATDTSATMPTCNQLKLGHWSTTNYFGHISRFTYYQNKVSNSQLKTLTS